MKSSILFIVLLISTICLTAQTKKNDEAIKNVVNEMAAAWKAGNGTQFSKVFTEIHDFIIYNGFYSKNRSLADNASHQQRLFDNTFNNTEAHFTIDKIEYLDNDIALIHVLGAITSSGSKRPVDPELLWTGILTKTNAGWKIKCLQLLELQLFTDPESKSKVPGDPQIMYASWYSIN